ncbi:MAG: ECF transporter S component [bacterium]|nr:ECF transporter S component [bacterium]
MPKELQTAQTNELPFQSVAQIAQIGVWSAAVAAVGYLFSFIPNVEAVTFTTALAGVFLGPINGAIVGGIGIAIYSLFNPWGFPPILLLLVQMVAMASIGGISGILKRFIPHRIHFRILFWGVVGLMGSLWYDLLTTLITPFLAEMQGQSLLVVLVAQIPFTAVKGLANIILFASLFDPLRLRIEKIRQTSLTMRHK